MFAIDHVLAAFLAGVVITWTVMDLRYHVFNKK